jgi:RNA polymerase sigma-70 factor, ECF subfamily
LLVTNELANAMALDAISVPALRKPAAKVSADFPDAADETSRLTRAIVSGDEEAFAKFYDQYSGRVYGLLLVMTSGREEAARDLQQIVMIKVARKLRVFRNEPELWAWLSQVVRNAFLDYARAQARRLKTPVAHESDASAGTDTQGGPLFEWLDEALQKLDDDERFLIEAFYFQNQRQSEIAQANGQTLKAVESKLARVRAKLRTFIIRRTRHEQ